MEDKKLFSAPRWNDPPVARVTGHKEISKEEQEKALQELIDEYFGNIYKIRLKSDSESYNLKFANRTLTF